jgi:single-stranded-DNA-specific exonuclease
MGVPLERAADLLDLVALGIVADIATQTGDTRYLLQRGLPALRGTNRAGLQAVMQMAQINPAQLTTDHIGFGLGPRLNALGRLGDANLAVELLTTYDISRARILAAQLEGLNSRRRLLTEQIYAAAQEQIARKATYLESHALVLSGPRWHSGVIGIVASRLAETYGLPTVLISEGEDGQGRGSARSVPGVNIHAAITAVGSLLTSHGGHPGAAGLSLPIERIAEFRRELARAVEAHKDPTMTPGPTIDAMLPWNALSLDLAEALSMLAPFGQGNPPVVLASQRLSLVSDSTFGRNRAHRRLVVRSDDGTAHTVTWWRGAEHPLLADRFDLAYTLKSSDFRGEKGLQIEFVNFRTIGAPPAAVALPPIQVVDYRDYPDPLSLLDRLRASGDLAIWAEGYPAEKSPGLRRDRLGPAAALAVWTSPPGPREWRLVLERVSPRTVYVFAIGSKATDPRRFMPLLAGFIKHTLHCKEGIADLERLAASSAQRVESVRAGIHLLAARGDVNIISDGDTTIHITHGSGQQQPNLDEMQAYLQAHLQETAAYRAFFARTAVERLA